MLKPMRSRMLLSLVPAAALASLLSAGSAAAGGRYYAWRTADGDYAFTDDAKAIPEAYRKSAETRTHGALGSYQQFTASDARATRDYEQRLDERLEHLRALNARAEDASAAERTQPSRPVVSLRTGGDNGPLLQIAGVQESDEPVIVETLRAHPANRLVTRNNIVVRQGDRTLTVIRSRGREWNVNDDIHVEDDLLR